MNYLATHLRAAIAAIGLAALAASPSAAGPRPEPSFKPVLTAVQADCYAIGQQVASQNGGTLARASLSNRGGQPVCIIVVVVPGKDGKRGSRQEFVVPAG